MAEALHSNQAINISSGVFCACAHVLFCFLQRPSRTSGRTFHLQMPSRLLHIGYVYIWLCLWNRGPKGVSNIPNPRQLQKELYFFLKKKKPKSCFVFYKVTSETEIRNTLEAQSLIKESGLSLKILGFLWRWCG